MKIKRIHLISYIIAGFLVSANSAWANSGIPGPIIWVGSVATVSPMQWLASCMFMCVCIEGAIYHYVGMFRRPLVSSLAANIFSLILGIPLMFLGAIDPTWFVLPTTVSILCEALLLLRLPASIGLKDSERGNKGKFWLTVLIANILTNFIIVLYLFWLAS